MLAEGLVLTRQAELRGLPEQRLVVLPGHQRRVVSACVESLRPDSSKMESSERRADVLVKEGTSFGAG